MMVFINNEKLHVSAYNGHNRVLTVILLYEFYIICLCVFYKILIARKWSKRDDGRCRPKHV